MDGGTVVQLVEQRVAEGGQDDLLDELLAELASGTMC